ncbi:MAG: response regulator [Arthrobacter sp.]|nr:response regulator [Arthrobacter sp.]
MTGQTGSTARIAIVEDHLLQRDRTKEILGTVEGYEVVFSGESLPDFVRWSEAASPEQRPQLLILDLMVERQASASPAHVASLVENGLIVLVLSAMASPALVRRIIQAGVAGVVGKRDSEQDFLAAVHAVLEGQEWMTVELASVIAGDPERPTLSIQEERALVLYASGLSVEQVGAAMNIGRETAKQYLDRVKRKYTAAGVPVRSKLDYGRVAWADGYLNPSLPREE